MKPKPQTCDLWFKPHGAEDKFPIRIPKSIVSAFQKLDEDEDCEILRSGLKVMAIHKKDIEDYIKKLKSAEESFISEVVEAKNKFCPPPPDYYQNFFEPEKAREPSDYKGVKEAALKAIKLFRDLNSPTLQPLYKQAILTAIGDNDLEFFKRFGRSLEHPQKHPLPAKPKEWTPLQELLINHWVALDSNSLPFCCFTDDALKDFIHCITNEEYTMPICPPWKSSLCWKAGCKIAGVTSAGKKSPTLSKAPCLVHGCPKGLSHPCRLPPSGQP